MSVSYSVHEVKTFFASAVSASFLNLAYHGYGVHLLIIKYSMLHAGVSNQLQLSGHVVKQNFYHASMSLTLQLYLVYL